jgi:hypothetical protein
MFVAVVLFVPDGIVGTAQKLMERFGAVQKPGPEAAANEGAKETVEVTPR